MSTPNQTERVSILLSTYQGARYLRPLLDSLLAQTYSNFIVETRDDGSSDRTLEILEAYALQHARIQVRAGKHLGVTRSFFNLLAEASPKSRYFAFCDQDDIWLPEKVRVAVSRLKEVPSSQPALYACRYSFISAEGNLLGDSPILRRTGTGNAILENTALGCTIVMNRAARKLLLSSLPDLTRLPSHDWWANLVMNACGTVIHDSGIWLLYRQHEGNDAGSSPSSLAKMYSRGAAILSGRKKPFPHRWLVQEVLRCFRNRIPSSSRTVLQEFVSETSSPLGRMRISLKPSIWRQSRFEDLLYRAKVASGVI